MFCNRFDSRPGMVGWGKRATVWFTAVWIVPTWIVAAGHAATLTVPGNFATIQDAIDAASPGDEIVVSPGHYLENLTIHGTGIVLRSLSPTSPTVVVATVVDGHDAGPVVTFDGNEPTSCVLSGLTLLNGRAPQGAAILGNGTLATIEHCRITSNTATGGATGDNFGGGLYDCDGTIRNNNVLVNSALDDGGGLYGCDGLIEDNQIDGNWAASYGGGLANCQGTIRGNVISHCPFVPYGGGLADCQGLIEDNTIGGNSALQGGGLFNCNGVVRGNTVVGNYAQGGGGGLASCNGTVENNQIEINIATGDGGGLLDCQGTIQANIITGNTAVDDYMYTGSGGGVFLTTGTLVNNFICQNRAYDAGGGVLVHGGRAINNTIVYNTVDTAGTTTFPGVVGYGAEIRNCIVYFNTDGGNTPLLPQAGPSLAPTYCCIQYWTGGGDGNIALNPDLTSGGNCVWRLLSNSPCIDAGGAVAGVTTDFEGDPRPYRALPPGIVRGDGSGFDIGADEFIGSIIVLNGWMVQ